MPKGNRYCSVPQCSAYCTKEVSLHYFPKTNAKLCKIWAYVLRIGKRVTKCMNVCSLHFRKEDFILTGECKRRRLKKDAIPSLKLPVSTGANRSSRPLIESSEPEATMPTLKPKSIQSVPKNVVLYQACSLSLPKIETSKPSEVTEYATIPKYSNPLKSDTGMNPSGFNQESLQASATQSVLYQACSLSLPKIETSKPSEVTEYATIPKYSNPLKSDTGMNPTGFNQESLQGSATQPVCSEIENVASTAIIINVYCPVCDLSMPKTCIPKHMIHCKLKSMATNVTPKEKMLLICRQCNYLVPSLEMKVHKLICGKPKKKMKISHNNTKRVVSEPNISNPATVETIRCPDCDDKMLAGEVNRHKIFCKVLRMKKIEAYKKLGKYFGCAKCGEKFEKTVSLNSHIKQCKAVNNNTLTIVQPASQNKITMKYVQAHIIQDNQNETFTCKISPEACIPKATYLHMETQHTTGSQIT